MNAGSKIHFIGICGVAMSAVATALWQKGYKITGSDSGFFPPISTHLKNLGIPYYSGWHPDKMCGTDADSTQNGRGKECPDLVVVGNAISSQNPELLYVQENKIPFKSYPEIVGEFLVQKNSIVVAGTWGKTTSSALLAHILRHAKWHPSYMTGGLTQDGAPSAAIDTGDWSVVEGDEYKTAKWDQEAKFFHYKLTHLLLTAVSWDHADMYPTEKSYFEAFEKLLKLIPKLGKIVACSDREPLVNLLESAKKEFVSYGANEKAYYRYGNVIQSTDGISFDIDYHGKIWNIQSPMLGAYNAENITGCFAMAREIGITPSDITDAIKEFRGMKRRLEKRYEHGVTVIDDIAHSPEKAKSVLANLRQIYRGKIIAIYEPNIGNRTAQSAPSYDNAFENADEVIIPRLTKLKVDAENSEKAFEGDELAKVISKTKKNSKYIEDDGELVKYITDGRADADCIAFLGSHGFRGMIEETIKKLTGYN
ncbi:MAG TPA: Mur ligase family protein [Candidatus Paceibacterota bacterium]|nr:Mur ligase family protein [Candidatus Paceibacterota bacterium]